MYTFRHLFCVTLRCIKRLTLYYPSIPNDFAKRLLRTFCFVLFVSGSIYVFEVFVCPFAFIVCATRSWRVKPFSANSLSLTIGASEGSKRKLLPRRIKQIIPVKHCRIVNKSASRTTSYCSASFTCEHKCIYLHYNLSEAPFVRFVSHNGKGHHEGRATLHVRFGEFWLKGIVLTLACCCLLIEPHTNYYLPWLVCLLLFLQK